MRGRRRRGRGRLQTRDLSSAFGSPLGAQLVDVYVHDPAAATTSTAASFPQRNYQIAAGSAWSRLIEVQGFGQRYVDPGTVPKAWTSSPRPGWPSPRSSTTPSTSPW